MHNGILNQTPLLVLTTYIRILLPRLPPSGAATLLRLLLLHESAVNGKVGLGCQPTLSCVTHTQQHRATD